MIIAETKPKSKEPPPAPSGRPRGGYRNAAGKKVPGVTTVISRFKDSGGLIYWANQKGLEGITLDQARDEACNAGTYCHDMIDCHLHRRIFDCSGKDPALLELANHAFRGYLAWAEQTKLSVVASEVSLVSEQHGFAGTFDAAVSGLGLLLLDYKTSNAIYADMLIQVGGGYSLLWKEHHPDKPLNGICILRVSKPKEPDDPISFHHGYWGPGIFPVAEGQFLRYLESYRVDKQLNAML